MILSHVLAGISWFPEIRGALSLLVGVVVLMGSVYLLLATNLANRLGFLIALTGIFGWMTLMALTWWIYGKGWLGDAPTWEVEEINTGDMELADLDDAEELAALEPVDPEELDQELQALLPDVDLEDPQADPFAELPEDFDLMELLPEDPDVLPDPRVLRELTPAQFEEVAARYEDVLGDWSLLSDADPSRGEAQAAVDEALTSGEYPGFAEAQDYAVLYGMETGGKPERESDSMVDRVTNRITNTLRVTNPPHYLVVQVQPAVPQELAPGEAAGSPEPSHDSDVVSVVMVRNIGDARLPSAVTTIVSGSIFLLLCYMLHVRDKTLMANRAAPLPEPAPEPSAPEPVGTGS